MNKLNYFLTFILLSFLITAGISNFDSITLDNDLIVGDDITVTDDVSIGGDLSLTGGLSSSTGTFTGAMVLGTTVSLDSAVTIGVDAFTTTAQTDTVTIAGATTGDFYLVCGKYTAGVDQQDVLQWQAASGKLIVHRLASGESALGYTWIRFKEH